MSEFIDLSHHFEDNMPGFRIKDKDGSFNQFTARIKPFLTHQESRYLYQGKSEFEITEMTFQTSIGTYLDSPYHRFSNMRDISDIKIEEVILEGIVIDVRNDSPFERTDINLENYNINNKAILFNFGWDKYWGKEEYYSYPFISFEIIKYLIENKVKLVGVDTLNIDDPGDLSRPAHTFLLQNEILIVENLSNLDKLYNNKFRFFAVPLKAKKTAAFPVRAFAEIL
jgi:arylformamidase